MAGALDYQTPSRPATHTFEPRLGQVQPLHVNVLGLSRGGIAAYMLARHACGLSCASRLRLSLCVFDPVPGNLISTAKYLDLLGNVTTANRHIDLRSCRIVRCLALYPADPLPDIAFHAPLLPDYPKGCEVEEDATLGCHQACTMEGTMQGLGQPTSHALWRYARMGPAHQACTVVYCTRPD